LLVGEAGGPAVGGEDGAEGRALYAPFAVPGEGSVSMLMRGMLAAGDGGSSGDGSCPLQVESQQLLEDLLVGEAGGPAIANGGRKGR
jgi:hypothetical protein